MPMIETDDGVGLYYRLDGAPRNPPLVLSPSLGTNLTMWDEQVELLAQSFHVIRYDPRGHGGSGVPAGEYSIGRLAKDVLNLLDALEIHRVSWCGVSMGGMVGMTLASRAPERLARLALCNTAAHLPPADLWTSRMEVVLSKGMDAVTDAVLSRWFTDAFRARCPDKVERVREMLLATAPVGYAGCCAAIRDMDLRQELAAIEHPVLVVAGRDDPATPPPMAEEIRNRIVHARLVVLDQCAHLSNIEQPAAFRAAVLPFLAAEAHAA